MCKLSVQVQPDSPHCLCQQPIFDSMATLAALYDFPPLPAAPPILSPVDTTSPSLCTYWGGTMIATARIKEALCPPRLQSSPFHEVPPQPRKTVPGWTDGSSEWRQSVYGYQWDTSIVPISSTPDSIESYTEKELYKIISAPLSRKSETRMSLPSRRHRAIVPPGAEGRLLFLPTAPQRPQGSALNDCLDLNCFSARTSSSVKTCPEQTSEPQSYSAMTPPNLPLKRLFIFDDAPPRSKNRLVYPLRNMIPKFEWKALSISAYMSAGGGAERVALLPFKRSNWINDHLALAFTSPSPNKTTIKMLIYISTMIAFHKATFNDINKDAVQQKLSMVPSIVIDGLLSRFTETARVSMEASEKGNMLLTHMFALCLHVDDFATDTSVLAADLSMEPAKVNMLFKSLGWRDQKGHSNGVKFTPFVSKFI